MEEVRTETIWWAWRVYRVGEKIRRKEADFTVAQNNKIHEGEFFLEGGQNHHINS